MADVLNVIHLPNDPAHPHREAREKSFKSQFIEQGIANFRVWDGVFDPENPMRGISRSHKAVVRDAMERGDPRVIVVEDDIRFTRPGAWDYFVAAIPADCDMFLGHVYYGAWDETGKLAGPFASMVLYCVNARFYKYFLSVTERQHIDIVMNRAMRYDIRVCLPMVCGQLNGWSDNAKTVKDWSPLDAGKPLF